VADTANDRVEVFDARGDYLRTLGVSARGQGVLTAPRGLATDPSRRLLVSDTVGLGGRIEAFAPGSGAFAGAWTTTGGHSSGFSRPAGVGVDPRGSVYVADPGNERVVRLWGDGTFLSERGGPAEIGGAQLSGAGAVAVAASTGQTYVADTVHNRVLVYSPEGSLLAKWGAGGGNGASGSQAGEFDHPAAVAVGSHGEVYVADEGNDRVVELYASGSVLTQWGSPGTTDGRFRGPTGVAVNEAGNVYVVDSENNRIQTFDSAGRFLQKWGLRGTDLGEFSQPTAVAVDCAGDVYVADTNNNRVERFGSVSPAPSRCLAAGGWPPPLDVAPVLRVSLPRRAGVLARRALALTVSCQRGCKVLVTAALTPRGRRGAVKLISAARAVLPALAGSVRLRVGAGALRRLRKALGRQAGMTAYVRIVAAGPTGRRTSVSRTYAVTR
jgi:DNA-binding beta-propeller fold protein YncE